jgi:indolepyruvate ferredoxin oxidoreductase
VLAARLGRIDMPADLRARINAKAEEIRARRKRLGAYKPPTTRLPYYCPGCPHNTSTRVPDGSRALAGIGCHYMAQWMNRHTETFTQMGGEGVPWVGISPFTSENHVFANLGDGTYMHSGIMALRQSIAAGANITYKILFNDAVAMTGGQAVDGQMTVPVLIRQIAAEGVKKIYLLTREPERYSEAALPAVVIEHRDAIDRVQREVREIPGCTAIVYDQTCATELRRKRARGLAPQAPQRAYINPAVCEGCGDCSDQSNCIAIDPLETEFGRKRAINQSACNADLSCLKGFCPSFVTVSGGTMKKQQGAKLPEVAIPAPASAALPAAVTCNIAITGVGGGGVLTLGHIIGMAAHIDGVGAQVLDITGLAQKGGAVVSHVRLAQDAKSIASQRIPAGGTDLLLATDLVVAASPEARQMIAAARTRAVIDTHVTPVASFIHDRDFDFQTPATLNVIERALKEPPAKLDFHHLALHAFGDSIAANMMLVGCAYQRGWLPVSERALTRAIELNGVAVALNLAAFQWGRFIAAFPERIDELTAREEKHRPLAAMSLTEIIEHRAQHLTAYQSRRLADRYRERVAQIRRVESSIGKGEELTRAVAINYAKLLAYKDEYEVARLFTDPSFKAGLDESFDGKTTLAFHLAPSLLSRVDPNTGRPKKIEFGPWVLSLFGVLASLKGLRGTPLDIFGYGEERRRERELIATYEGGLDLVAAKLSADNYPCAIALAALPEMVRGFGPVKMKAIDRFEREWRKLQPQLLNPAPETQPAEAAE